MPGRREKEHSHEVHVDHGHAVRRLRQVHELAEEGHRGEHRLHDCLQQEVDRRGGARERGGTGVPVGSEARPRGQGRQADHHGVFPESKEFLAGYWIVDVESSERAYLLAAEASTAPGPGVGTEPLWIEVRELRAGTRISGDVAAFGLRSRAASMSLCGPILQPMTRKRQAKTEGSRAPGPDRRKRPVGQLAADDAEQPPSRGGAGLGSRSPVFAGIAAAPGAPQLTGSHTRSLTAPDLL